MGEDAVEARAQEDEPGGHGHPGEDLAEKVPLEGLRSSPGLRDLGGEEELEEVAVAERPG